MSLDLKLFATQEHPCSYLAGAKARTLFVDPDALIGTDTYSLLTDAGFRRSGAHFYRPHCSQCDACISVRIPVQDYVLKRRDKRCLARNQDLRLELTQTGQTDAHYALYARYISDRHSDGDMYPPSREQYTEFLAKNLGFTQYFNLYQGSELVAVAVSDRLHQGLSAIYTYFAPELAERSLGRYAILLQLAEAKALGLPFVYLGYWIEACPKMRYKTDFRPLQMRIEQQWMTLY
jgi:leucyl-tRNA---protein transferase